MWVLVSILWFTGYKALLFWTALYPIPTSYAEARAPNTTTFGDKVHKKVINVQWSHKVGVLIQRIGVPIRRGQEPRSPSICRQTAGRPREDAVRSWLSASRESHQTSSHLAPWFWTYRCQSSEKINFCCANHPVCEILLEQPNQFSPTVTFICPNNKERWLTSIVILAVETKVLTVRKFAGFALNHLGNNWWTYDWRSIPSPVGKLRILPSGPIKSINEK